MAMLALASRGSASDLRWQGSCGAGAGSKHALTRLCSGAASTKFNAKVMLIQGLPKDWLNLLEETHMSRLIKFLCVKNSKYGLMCMGGMWQKELDGGKEVRSCCYLASLPAPGRVRVDAQRSCVGACTARRAVVVDGVCSACSALTCGQECRCHTRRELAAWVQGACMRPRLQLAPGRVCV